MDALKNTTNHFELKFIWNLNLCGFMCKSLACSIYFISLCILARSNVKKIGLPNNRTDTGLFSTILLFSSVLFLKIRMIRSLPVESVDCVIHFAQK